MSEVKRYWHVPNKGFAVLDPQYYGEESGYIAHDDYAALEAECERLRGVERHLRQHKNDYMEAAEGTKRALEADLSASRLQVAMLATCCGNVGNDRDALAAELAAIRAQEPPREWPDDEIVSAWKWCEENGGTPAEFLSHSLLVKRSRVLGRPLTWREAIELTHATTDMPDEQRDKLLAMDDAPPPQPSTAALVEALKAVRLGIASAPTEDDDEMQDRLAQWEMDLDAALAAHAQSK